MSDRVQARLGAFVASAVLLMLLAPRTVHAACVENNECPACQVCALQSCTPLPGACQTGADCLAGQQCVGVQPGSACTVCRTPCTGDASCGSCGSCDGGFCTGSPACKADSDCEPDWKCAIDTAKACANQCVPMSPCTIDGDCGTCGQCVVGGCKQMTGGCAKDADCSSGDVCQIDSAAPCNNKCIIAPCKTDGDCGTCGSCKVGGACASVPGGCTDASQCGAYENCQIDSVAPCNNKCVGMACTVNGECGQCGQCKDGACTVPPPLCAKDADCGAGKVCEIDNNASCNNKCVIPVCKVDAECGICGACNSGACLSVAPECSKDAECAAGLACQIDSAAPCKNKCVAASCTSDGDCGACGGCILGKCKIYKSECDTEGDCAKGQTCKFDANVACKNACVAKPCTIDSQCGTCGKCNGGACSTLKPVCSSASDCAVAETCVVDSEFPCNNKCITASCTVDGDCGGCAACQNGFCQATPPVCAQDADCAAGQGCLLAGKLTCNNKCVPLSCTADDQCGTCGACKTGACMTVAPACGKDADCGAGKACLIDKDAPCNNKCFTPPCSFDTDCGLCAVCSGAVCKPVVPVCVKDADCPAGEGCQIDGSAPCQNKCATLTCKVNADCGVCAICQSGWCEALPPGCKVDGDCSETQTCKVDAAKPCQSACVAKACSSSATCGACGACSQGLCKVILPACTQESDCGTGQTCQFDENLACKNNCVAKTCEVDGDCGQCGACVTGKCGAAKPVCTVNSECPAGQACAKPDAKLPCQNYCHVPPCGSDADCGGCQKCSQSACVEIAPSCTQQAGCGSGLTCVVDAQQPCKNACLPTSCTADNQCGTCGACKLGACAIIAPACSKDTDCGAGKACLIDKDAPCNNKCFTPPCAFDTDCGPCAVCSGAVCKPVVPVCVKDADCSFGEGCQIDGLAPCQNKCAVLACAADADCGACGACKSGSCVALPPGCKVDGDCSEIQKCQVDADKPCQSACVTKACSSSATCGACGACSQGLCQVIVPTCLQESDCGKGQTCQFDANLPCNNNCVAKSCTEDGDCGQCGACVAGKCGAAKPVCTVNSECPAGQACAKPDAKLPCQNYCHVPPCSTDADCGSCKTCSQGSCANIAVACTQPADCGSGLICIVDAQQPCKNACLPPNCKVDGDCPSCQACWSGSCKAIVPACSKGADCAAGKYCLVDAAKPCKNTCEWPACTTDSDCAECSKCTAGGCQPVAAACMDDGSCGVGKICVKDPLVACKASCQTAPCTKSEQCGTCGVCVAGACLAQSYVECSGNGDCSSKQICKVVAGAACQNACVTKPGCSTDADCGACQACENGSCGAAQQAACTKDAECGLGLVCKLDASACKNKCVVATCLVDADCPSCVTCVGGSCTGQGKVVCLVDGDCGFGKACKTNASSPCSNACETSGCKTAGECGPCGTCNGGVCGLLAAPCDDQGGCGAGQVCKIAAGEACKNQCELAPVTQDAGPPVEPDGGSAWDGGPIADTGAGADDAASDDVAVDGQEPEDTAVALDTEPGEDAVIPEDVAVAQDTADSQDAGATADSGPGKVDAGPLPADGGGSEIQDDVGIEEPAQAVPPRKSTWGCSAGGGAGGSGWAILLAFAAGAVWVRRRRGLGA